MLPVSGRAPDTLKFMTDLKKSASRGRSLRRGRGWLTCIWVGVLCLLLGCGPSTGDLRRHLDASAFDKAVEAATGKNRLELQLAVLVIENHLTAGGPTELMDMLLVAGKPGRRALERLESAEDERISTLADIALRQREEPEIDDVMLVVNSDDSDIRAYCIRAWHSHMTRIILERALMDHDPRVRLQAVNGIVDLGMEEDVSGLLRESLRLDPSSAVRAEAARHGKLLGPDVVLVLKKALEDNSPGVRYAAMRGLAETENDDAIAMLEDIAVGAKDHGAVVAAAELARMGRAVGRTQLLAAVEDDRPDIRKAALLRLERAGIGERDEIFEKCLGDEDPEVILLAARLLRGKQGARKTMMEALRKIGGDESPCTAEARNLLAALGDTASLDEVRKVMAGDKEQEILKIVREVGGVPFLKDAFVRLIASKSESVRIEAAKAVVLSMSKI